MRCIDFHTHIFPDHLAKRAVHALEQEANERAFLDGTLADLRRSMQRHGIEHCVIASIATKPEQFEPMLQWSKTLRAKDIVPFLSVHPDDPLCIERVKRIQQEGFKGIKLHPYYQEFVLDDPCLRNLYEAISDAGLILLVHTGFDIAFERVRRCDPRRVMNVRRDFPDLNLVATHCGGWDDWDAVEKHLLGKPVLMDMSYSRNVMGEARFRHILNTHPADYLVFGSDSPWADQGQAMADLVQAVTDTDRLGKILYGNAARLLGIG